MSAWSELPNASHIDRVIASLEAHSEVWSMVWEGGEDMDLGVTQDMAWRMAWSMALNAEQGSVIVSALNAARPEGPAHCAWAMARGAIMALIAYDDSTKYLEMTSNELKVWIELSQDPAAILLLPYLLVQEQLSTVHI